MPAGDPPRTDVLKEGTTNEHELLYNEDVFDIVGCAMEKNCLLKIDNRQRTQIWNNINIELCI